MENDKVCLVLTNSNSYYVSYFISKKLVDVKLASFVYFDVVDAIFFWNHNLQKSKEYRLVIKTLDSKYSLVEKFIKKNHNYNVPPILKIDVDKVSYDYLNWMLRFFG